MGRDMAMLPCMKGSWSMGVQTREKLLCARLVASKDVPRTGRDASMEGNRVDNDARHVRRR